MELRTFLEAMAAAIIALVMFLAGRGCENAENYQGLGPSDGVGTEEVDY